MAKIRVMLVEDHVLVREGTKELLNREEDLQVIAETGDGEEAIWLAARGMTNREIGGIPDISARTVQFHLSNVFGKLAVGSRTEAVVYAVREGWLPLKDAS